MANFAKAFISHSSTDKKLVEDVLKQFSEARLEIDSLTFEEGKTSGAEIHNAITRSDLFVLFASERAVNDSDWITSELEIVQHYYYKRTIKGVLVFIVDDTPIKSLPDWLRMHVVAHTNNVVRIANSIKGKLMLIDSLSGARERPYVQRNTLRADLEKKLSDATNHVRAVYISGVDGIGRRTFITSTFKDLYPGSDVIGVNIPLALGEGLLEAYQKLFIEWRRPVKSEINSFLANSISLEENELVSNMVELINEIGGVKSYVWLQLDYSAISDDGVIDPQFHALLTSLSSNRPTLIVRANRLPKFTTQRQTPNISYHKIESLSDPESLRLWKFALGYFELDDIDQEAINFLNEQVNGHPNLIWLAAEYVAQTGLAAMRADMRTFAENLQQLSMSLIDGLPLSAQAKKILALFDEFGTLSIEDLLIIFDGADELSVSVTALMNYSLLESDENYLRLAPYFQHARFRKRFSVDVDKFLQTARCRLLEALSNYQEDENISFATIDSGIMSAIKEGKSMPFNFDSRAIVGSHYLRVARSYYDRGDYSKAKKFCENAYAKVHSLTLNASIETLRLLGMSAVRTDDNKTFEVVIEELNGIGTQQSKRHAHFIKGFEMRWNGNSEKAEAEFNAVLESNTADVHALRELSQILLMREEFGQAEALARRAMQTPGRNPFMIDILLQCLIEKRRRNLLALREDTEIANLFGELEIADRRERSVFYPLRRAQYLAALGDPKEALAYANIAVKSNPQIRSYATRAEIKLSLKHDPEILSTTLQDIKEVERLAHSVAGGKRHLDLTSKLRIRYELASNNVREAIKVYDRVAHNLGNIHNILAKEIANYIVDKGIAEKDLVIWANRILSI